MQTLHISGHTDVGKQRKDNQDAFICENLWSEDMALIAVIDGVGGYAGGDKAAAIAKESISKYMNTPKGDTLTMLREAIVFANNQIVEERKSGKYPDMCCVITAAVVDARSNRFYFVHVGDTRLYRFRREQLEKITKDHSLVGLREDAGEISESDAMNHPQRNIILREVGSREHRIDDEDFLEYGENDFQLQDILLICSDGLSDMVPSNIIARQVKSNESLDRKITELIDLANQYGGKDNITVVLAQNNRTDEVPASAKDAPVQSIAEPVITSVEDNTGEKKKGFKRSLLLIPALLIALLLIIFLVVDFKQPQKQPPGKSDSLGKTTPDTINILPKSNSTTEKNSTPADNPIPDSLILTKTISLKEIIDTLNSNNNAMTVIIPSKNFNMDSAAIEFSQKDSGYIQHDTLIIKNLHLKHFKTGIKISTPVYVQLENTVFEDVRQPFYFDVKKDNKKSFSIITKTNR